MLRTLRTLMVVSIVALAALAQNVTPAQAVVGGTWRAPADFPYFVVVQDQIALNCGGTVIEAGWVLTAAHCVFIPFTVGSPPLADPWGSDVAQVYFHPLWDGDGAHGHDLALLRLADNDSAGVPPIQVGAPWHPELYAAGTAATIMGIGPPNLGFLAAADTRIDNAATMQATYSAWNSVLQIGAGDASHTTCSDPYNGDDGGPLVVNGTSGQPVQVGVASLYDQDCVHPAGFAVLAGSQLAWVASVVPTIMNRWGPCTDIDGTPGHSEADYQPSYAVGYQPDGPYYWKIWCGSKLVPNLRGNTLKGATAALRAVGLSLGSYAAVVDPTCTLINEVIRQSPPAGIYVSPGTAVTITLGQPPFRCP